MAAGQDQEKASPFMAMFEKFRSELDEHHDRRERIIKASRDITASSKKIIFALQRVRKVHEPIPPPIAKSLNPHLDVVTRSFDGIIDDLQGLNSSRYRQQITGGIQEYLEALTFQNYLENQKLLGPEEAEQHLNGLVASDKRLDLTIQDYLLAVYDMTGELMRFAITSSATLASLPQETPQEKSNKSADPVSQESQSHRTVLQDLQVLNGRLRSLDPGSNHHFKRDLDSKQPVTQSSVEKVEKAFYGLVVRGSERPEGWVPDVSAE